MENLAKQFRRRGPHNDSGARRLLTRFTDLHVLEVERAAHHKNRVQDLRQDQRIDDMALKQDGFLVIHHKSHSHSYMDRLRTDSTTQLQQQWTRFCLCTNTLRTLNHFRKLE